MYAQRIDTIAILERQQNKEERFLRMRTEGAQQKQRRRQWTLRRSTL
jgi:hypothetical protein